MISSEHAERSGANGVREAVDVQNAALVLTGIVALGAALRLIALGYKSFWLDEIASVVIVRMPGNSFWSWLWHSEGNMALYYVMLRTWLHFGVGEASVRMLSVLPGIASLPVMYLLGGATVRAQGRDPGGAAPLREYLLRGVFAGGARLQLAAAGRDFLDLPFCAAD